MAKKYICVKCRKRNIPRFAIVKYYDFYYCYNCYKKVKDEDPIVLKKKYTCSRCSRKFNRLEVLSDIGRYFCDDCYKKVTGIKPPMSLDGIEKLNPDQPEEGSRYYNTTTGQLYIMTDGEWLPVSEQISAAAEEEDLSGLISSLEEAFTIEQRIEQSNNIDLYNASGYMGVNTIGYGYSGILNAVMPDYENRIKSKLEKAIENFGLSEEEGLKMIEQKVKERKLLKKEAKQNGKRQLLF